MADEFTDFIWPKNVRDASGDEGYGWYETTPIDRRREPKQWFLSDRVGLGERYLFTPYAPLRDESGLFRVFAETEPSKAGILAFAKGYGRLGIDETGIHIPIGARRNAVDIGEPFDSWKQEINEMWELLNLWDLTQNTGGVGDLERIIIWKETDCFVVRAGKSAPVPIATKDHHPELIPRLLVGDLVGPALYYLQRCINARLTKFPSRPQLLWNRHRTRMGIHVVPQNLIGALWLQFARAVDGDREYRRCNNCRKWFEISGSTTRSDKVFCSATCKAAANRKKRTEAIELHRKRVPVQEIAKRLNTTAKTVKGWVGK